MRTFMRAVLVATLCLPAACAAPRQDARQQGRAYTDWFYQRNFEPLWNRFSPEMKQTFPTPESLASFAGRTVKQLGRERGSPLEQLIQQDTLTVYSRQATFERSAHPMLLQWTLTRDGMVTGFLLRPADQ
ncbi:MAG TPA: hypothetical protein VFK36_00815 [Gemmatimonadales bacterium]|nr:hypothetical protein [Gemmatimonadales bacterium]